jgi:hypothetical protein
MIFKWINLSSEEKINTIFSESFRKLPFYETNIILFTGA